MQTATSQGGLFVLLPRSLTCEWSKAIGENPEPSIELYGRVCESDDFMHTIEFREFTVVRLADEPSDLFWVPDDRGGLILQWLGADSLKDLIAFGRKVAASDEWRESLQFSIADPEVRIMDSCGFDGDGQPKIDLSLDPGEYQMDATYAENDVTMATVFRLARID